VSGAAQRGGIGRQLLARALERAPALGLATLVGFIFAHNTASVTLFERHGFARWAAFRASRASTASSATC